MATTSRIPDLTYNQMAIFTGRIEGLLDRAEIYGKKTVTVDDIIQAAIAAANTPVRGFSLGEK